MTEPSCVPSSAMPSLSLNRILSNSKFSIIRRVSHQVDGKPMVISCVIGGDACFQSVEDTLGGTHVRILGERKLPDLSHVHGSKCFTISTMTMTTECLRLKVCNNAPIINVNQKFSEILRRNHLSSRSSFLSSSF